MIRLFHFVLLASLTMAARQAVAQDDPGRENLAQLAVTVYHATDGDPAVAGDKARPVDEATERLLRAARHLDFKHYRALGRDVQPLFRGYENWAEPLKPSDEVLIRFEARSRAEGDAIRVGLELWLSRRQILKTDARLAGEQPLFILGPEWRGGRLIIAIELAGPLKKDAP
jgi:hypothetical protein